MWHCRLDSDFKRFEKVCIMPVVKYAEPIS